MKFPLWLLLAFLMCSCRESPRKNETIVDPAPGFWIWHRSSDLSPEELQLLERAGSGRLYRQVAEFSLRDGDGSPRVICTAESLRKAPETIPVLRIDPGPALLERPDAAHTIAKWLRYHFKGTPPDTLQIDYDCSARLLPRYAELLRELKTELGLDSISVTALASWIDAPAFGEFATAVDEVVPMFYDLTADSPEDIIAGRAVAMIDEETTRWIDRWSSCPVTWRAGLPNFQRLSLFNADGTIIGHLRQWSPETILSSRYLEVVPDFIGGAAYRVIEDHTFYRTPLQERQLLLWRTPSDTDLIELVERSIANGASGIVWFALPGPGIRTCHSPPHLASLSRGQIPSPALSMTVNSAGQIILKNNGPGDLSLLPNDTMHRLRLEANQPGSFAASGPGEFFEILTDTSVDFSHKLVLTFPRLDVGSEIVSSVGFVTQHDLLWSVDGSPTATPK